MNRREISTSLLTLMATGVGPHSLWAQSRTTIKVGITAAGQPASGLNPQTRLPEGFAVEIVQALAADAGLAVEFRPMPFSELQASLLEKQVDAIAGSFGITAERQKVVDFTRPYGSYRDVLIVSAFNPASYRAVADVRGMRIATSRGSSYVKPLEEAGALLSLSASSAESFGKLEAGNVDGVIENELQLRYLLSRSPRTDYRVVDTYVPILVGHLAFAVRKGDADLLLKLDSSLAKLEASGLVAEIMRKWGVPRTRST